MWSDAGVMFQKHNHTNQFHYPALLPLSFSPEPSVPAVSVERFLSDVVRLVAKGKLTAGEESRQTVSPHFKLTFLEWLVAWVWQAAQVFDNTNEAEGSHSVAHWNFIQFINCKCAFIVWSLWKKKKIFFCCSLWMCCFLSSFLSSKEKKKIWPGAADGNLCPLI